MITPSRIVCILFTGSMYTCTSYAETNFALYFGKNFTIPGNVRLNSQSGNRIFHKVSWRDESFVRPMYYGIRVTHWPKQNSQYGVSLDFTHAKMYANLNETIKVEDTDTGQLSSAPLSQTFKRFALSHGYNYLTLNAMLKPDLRHTNVVTPYVGLGAGFSVPHIEVTTSSENVNDYVFTGPVLQGLAGMKLSNKPLMMEYKYSYGNIKAKLSEGSEISLNPSTHHIVLGLTY